MDKKSVSLRKATKLEDKKYRSHPRPSLETTPILIPINKLSRAVDKQNKP